MYSFFIYSLLLAVSFAAPLLTKYQTTSSKSIQTHKLPSFRIHPQVQNIRIHYMRSEIFPTSTSLNAVNEIENIKMPFGMDSGDNNARMPRVQFIRIENWSNEYITFSNTTKTSLNLTRSNLAPILPRTHGALIATHENHLPSTTTEIYLIRTTDRLHSSALNHNSSESSGSSPPGPDQCEFRNSISKESKDLTGRSVSIPLDPSLGNEINGDDECKLILTLFQEYMDHVGLDQNTASQTTLESLVDTVAASKELNKKEILNRSGASPRGFVRRAEFTGQKTFDGIDADGSIKSKQNLEMEEDGKRPTLGFLLTRGRGVHVKNGHWDGAMRSATSEKEGDCTPFDYTYLNERCVKSNRLD